MNKFTSMCAGLALIAFGCSNEMGERYALQFTSQATYLVDIQTGLKREIIEGVAGNFTDIPGIITQESLANGEIRPDHAAPVLESLVNHSSIQGVGSYMTPESRKKLWGIGYALSPDITHHLHEYWAVLKSQASEATATSLDHLQSYINPLAEHPPEEVGKAIQEVQHYVEGISR